MRYTRLVMGVCATICLVGCDAIQFPGARERAERKGPPPPPPLEPVNPISIDGQPIDVPGLGPDSGSGPDGIPAPTPTEPVVPVSDLAQINALRCGLSDRPDDTMTLAELTGAQEAEPTVGAAAVNAVGALRAAYPGIVKLEPKRVTETGGIASGHCGATRIAEHWFATAAHCLDSPYDEIQLIAGQENLRHPLAIKVDAVSTVCHGGYTGIAGNYANDVALIEVSPASAARLSDVPITRFGAPQNALTPLNYGFVDMAGWGLTEFGGSLSETLMSAELSLVGSGPAAIVVGSIDGSGPCVGDSGGPLFVTEGDGSRTMVGVLSVVEQNRETGGFCEGQYQGRYTNLAGFEDWISSVMGACDARPELCAR